MNEREALAYHILKCLSPQGLRGMKLMVAASDFVLDDRSFAFRFKGNRDINHVTVSLNGADLFDLKFGRIWGGSYSEVSEHNDIFVENLAETFRSATGLETQVPTFR